MTQVARSLGILDEVNRMKVVPGASPSSSLTNKNVRYMEVNIPLGQVLRTRFRVDLGPICQKTSYLYIKDLLYSDRNQDSVSVDPGPSSS